MVIDFHTHAFSDGIAGRAMAKLEATVEGSGFPNIAKPVTDGTVGGLLRIMDDCGVDCSVVLPIVTKPSQQTVVNDWAAGVMSDRLYAFGSVHPDAPDALAELGRLRALGLRGVKFHPDYQDFFADEEKMFPIYEKCAELGLPVLLHAGLDPLSMDVIHCTPKMGAAVADRFPELTLIMAHLGGSECWDEAEEELVGRALYLDTAFTAGYLPDEQVRRIIAAHGADRILFASDCPWHSPAEELTLLNRLGLDEGTLSLIYRENALRVLGDDRN